MNEPLQPYRGLRVLDAGQGIAGPYCGMLLAAAGADVIKLEPPEGDWSRGLSTRKDGQSVMSVTFNRGKRSLVLDLKTPEGRAAAAALAARADVLIEAFRPGVAARLGLGPEATPANAVYLSISGFGQQGPYAERPCTDSVAQAFSGLVALNEGADGIPHKVNCFVSDVLTGVFAFASVQAALAQRALDLIPQRALDSTPQRALDDSSQRASAGTPRRHILDLSLMAGTAALMALPIAETGLLGREPAAMNVPAGSYRAACGGWLMVTLVREAEFVALCGVLGRPELPRDPRFASFAARAEYRDALLPILRDCFASRDRDDWLAALHGARLLSSTVNRPGDWLADPHVRAAGAAAMVPQPELGDIPMPALPGLGHWTKPAPGLGQHSAEILAEIAGF